MTPKGRFVFNVAFGKTNYSGDEWVYPGCVSYTQDKIAQELQAVGLKYKWVKDPVVRKPNNWVVASRSELKPSPILY